MEHATKTMNLDSSDASRLIRMLGKAWEPAIQQWVLHSPEVALAAVEGAGFTHTRGIGQPSSEISVFTKGRPYYDYARGSWTFWGAWLPDSAASGTDSLVYRFGMESWTLTLVTPLIQFASLHVQNGVLNLDFVNPSRVLNLEFVNPSLSIR